MTVTSAPRDLSQITRQIDAQFRELPGMRLTEPQVRRLCHLSADECGAALESMIEEGTLTREPSGHYRTSTDA